jgi:hypothetical protein
MVLWELVANALRWDGREVRETESIGSYLPIPTLPVHRIIPHVDGMTDIPDIPDIPVTFLLRVQRG